ncbi:MAG: dienelactone hydrolase family protein [Chloroflexota bacterium]|nr:dienelactone hydrolase family protein [Chloroflexota bacterium]
MIAYDGEESKIQAYLVKPAQEGPHPVVIVIHEILGLNDQIKGIANRFAAEGYVAFAPDLFSRPELASVLIPSNIEETMAFVQTPGWEKMSDRVYMQQALSQHLQEKREIIQRTLPVLFGGISEEKSTQDLVKALDFI